MASEDEDALESDDGQRDRWCRVAWAGLARVWGVAEMLAVEFGGVRWLGEGMRCRTKEVVVPVCGVAGRR
ncbi:unnamed protein product [Sphenostylis stenocarpa]|uniref:Uncharacterized protein n=1 Tax=Sphenostylis stenocarpa TaxID=92480 RepID=A0AA86SPV9_9FABA|nr:unnamed protein product [Sphenostylis stenocarpa]